MNYSAQASKTHSFQDRESFLFHLDSSFSDLVMLVAAVKIMFVRVAPLSEFEL